MFPIPCARAYIIYWLNMCLLLNLKNAFLLWFLWWLWLFTTIYALGKGFLNSSIGKESACNAGDPGLIPGSRRSAGEGIGYPLQYSWALLVAQLVKNLPTMQETWVWSLGWENPLEKGKATHSSILAWRIPWNVKSMGSQRVRHDWATFTSPWQADRYSLEQVPRLNSMVTKR